MRTEKNGFGCSIYSVNAKKAATETIRELKDLLYKNRLIVLKEQDLSDE